MCETYDLSWPEADKLIKRVDRQRHNYYKYVTGKIVVTVTTNIL